MAIKFKGMKLCFLCPDTVASEERVATKDNVQLIMYFCRDCIFFERDKTNLFSLYERVEKERRQEQERLRNEYFPLYPPSPFNSLDGERGYFIFTENLK